jgi:CheY-like chemotaxis protein
MRIVIADDEVLLRQGIARLLTDAGFEVVATAGTRDELIRAVERHRPDLAIVDIGLPKLDGYEVAQRIRHQPWGQGMVLIALTGWGQETDRQRSQEAGFDHHLVKPVDPAALMRLLATLPSPG